MGIDVSIIIPVYNPVIEEFRVTLTSVFNQSFLPENYEIIIIDDGNDDAVAIENLLAEFKHKKVKTTLHHHPKNRGVAAARETGTAKAQGEFVTFLDADDYLTSDALELMFNTAKKEEADMVVGGMMWWYTETGIFPMPQRQYAKASNIKDRIIEIFLSITSFSMCGILFARENLLQHLAFPDHLLHEESATLPRIAMAMKKIVPLSKSIYFYRTPQLTRGSILSKVTKNHVEGIVVALQSNLALLEKYNLWQDTDVMSSLEVFYQGIVGSNLSRGCRLVIKCFADRKSFIQFAVQEFTPILELFEVRSEILLKLEQLFLQLSRATSDEQVVALIEDFIPDVVWYHGISTIVKDGALSRNALTAKDKIVIICLADYHIRNAVKLVKEFRLRGKQVLIIDFSAVAEDGQRQAKPSDCDGLEDTEILRPKISRLHYHSLLLAQSVIRFNDHNEGVRLVAEFRRSAGLPVCAIVEGISDFRRVDFVPYTDLSYRRSDIVLLAGAADRPFFTDRKTAIAGIATIAELFAAAPVPCPKKFSVLVNCNFTYGVLPAKREVFLQDAKTAIDYLQLDYSITRHPMEESKFHGYKVTRETQNDAIRSHSVFVSRFATGILEALAIGRPVIYFNPHNEKVEKFKQPMGAFTIAKTPKELVIALRQAQKDIEQRVDFKQRARPFLEQHCGLAEQQNAPFAEAIDFVLQENKAYENLDIAKLIDGFRHEAEDGSWFPKELGASLNEAEAIGRILSAKHDFLEVHAKRGLSVLKKRAHPPDVICVDGLAHKMADYLVAQGYQLLVSRHYQYGWHSLVPYAKDLNFSAYHGKLVAFKQPKDLRAFETATHRTLKFNRKWVENKIIVSSKFVFLAKRFIRKLPVPHLYTFAKLLYHRKYLTLLAKIIRKLPVPYLYTFLQLLYRRRYLTLLAKIIRKLPVPYLYTFLQLLYRRRYVTLLAKIIGKLPVPYLYTFLKLLYRRRYATLLAKIIRKLPIPYLYRVVRWCYRKIKNREDLKDIDVSIIIPVYNPIIEEFRLALASAFNQAFLSENYEIIIVNDGSDDTMEIENVLAEFKHKKVKITLHHHPKNRGLAAARETGTAIARGEFVTFLDADDYLTSDALEAMFNTAKKRGADMVVGAALQGFFGIQMWPFASESYTDTANLKNRVIELYSKSTSTMWGILYSRENLLPHLSCPDHLLHEDMITLPRIALAAKKIVPLDKIIYFYRKGSAQAITGAMNENRIKGVVFGLRSNRALLEKYNLLQDAEVIRALDGLTIRIVVYFIVQGSLAIIKDFADRKSFIQFTVQEFTPFLEAIAKPSNDSQNLKNLFLQLLQATSDAQVIELVKNFSSNLWEYNYKLYMQGSLSQRYRWLLISTKPEDLRAFETAMLDHQKTDNNLVDDKIGEEE